MERSYATQEFHHNRRLGAFERRVARAFGAGPIARRTYANYGLAACGRLDARLRQIGLRIVHRLADRFALTKAAGAAAGRAI